MPTITLYVTEEVKKQLTQVIKKRSKREGIKVSRGDVIIPHIKHLYKQEFPSNGKAHIVGNDQPVEIIPTGELSGVVKGDKS